MTVELTSLDLAEVSLVDRGDDPLAKVALYKRKKVAKAEQQEEDVEKGVCIEIEIKSPEEEMMEAKMEAEQEAAAGAAGDMEKAAEEVVEEITKSDLEATIETMQEELDLLKAKLVEAEAEVEKFQKAEMEKAAKEDMIDFDGEMVAKSAIPSAVLKKLEEIEKAREAENLRKRADELIPNFVGTADERGKLLKSVGDDEKLLEILKAADKAFAGLFVEVGKTDAQNDLKSAEELLNDMVKGYQEQKGVDFYKAYAAVIKTAEGKKLLLETYK